jgi:hypothetical protein
MRRIGRYILYAIAVVSMVTCVGTVGFWIRSYDTSDVARWFSDGTRAGDTDLFFYSAGGRFTLTIMTEIRIDRSPDRIPAGFSHQSWPTVRVPGAGGPGFLHKLGFAAYSETASDYVDHVVRVPHWALLLIFLTLPAAALASLLRRRKASDGRCPGFPLVPARGATPPTP